MSHYQISNLNQEKTQVPSETEFSTNSDYLTLGKSRFHYTWLRDYCLCETCRHPGSSQRLFDISDHLNPPKPLSIEQKDETITIQWNEEPPHQSIFPISWLLSRANRLNLTPSEEQKKYLWDRAWLDANPPQQHSVHTCSEQVYIDELLQRGFTILRDLQPSALEPFLTSLGKIHETEYGQSCTIEHLPNPKDLAMDCSHPLPLHTDLRHKSAHRLILCQYCVNNTVKGGQSVLVDGFRVAEDFRKQHPDYFQTLVEVPVQFRYFDPEYQYLFQHETPIIKLDKMNNVSDIYFGHHNCDKDVPFAQTTAFYEAYCALYRNFKKSAYQYSFRLEASCCVLIQNFRILHGRMPFDGNSGTRQVEIIYVDWDYLIGRQNFHKVKHLYLNAIQQ